MNKIRQIPEPFSLQDTLRTVVFSSWVFAPQALLRALDVNDRVSLSDKNVYDYKFLFFVRIHIRAIASTFPILKTAPSLGSKYGYKQGRSTPTSLNMVT